MAVPSSSAAAPPWAEVRQVLWRAAHVSGRRLPRGDIPGRFARLERSSLPYVDKLVRVLGQPRAMNVQRVISTLTVATLSLVAISTLVGCTRTGAPVATTPQPSLSATLGSPEAPASAGDVGDIQPVSATKPGAEAADVMSKCHVGESVGIGAVSLEQVTGMGKIASAAELPHYVPLTGREPQLKDPGPAWVVQVKGDITQKNSEVWTDPTCVVTSSIFGYFGTGPTKLQNGDVVAPQQPEFQPDRTLPPLAP